MFLSRMRVENFRGIVVLDLELDETTILIGESASGKTSVLELLAICLGAPGNAHQVGFRDSDFHRGSGDGGGNPPPIVTRLTFSERKAGEWDELRQLVEVFVKTPAGHRALTLEVRAELGAAGIATEYRFLGADDETLRRRPDAETIEAVRELSPFVLVRTGRDLSRPNDDHDDASEKPGSDLALEREIGRVYELIVASDGPPPASELRKGLSAVAELLGENPERVFRHAEAPSRALRELVERPVVMSINAGPQMEAQLHGAGARSVALLLLLGAVLEARGPRTISPDAATVLAIEEPEVHLHPLMLAAVWSVIESLRAQKIVTTNSSDLLASARLGMVRRLVRRPDHTDSFRLGAETLTLDETRKVTYHIRLKRDDALFARAWLLVEGETEVWLLPELARQAGCDFASEGISVVEFAQAGVEPLVKLANDLGIEWHLIADGDAAGHSFVEVARRHLGGARESDRISVLAPPDMEHCLWDSGYAYVYHSIARGRSYVTPTAGKKSRKNPSRVIDQAIRNSSKPFLALTVVEQAAEEGSPGVPAPLRAVIEKTLRLARAAAPAATMRPAQPSRRK